MSPKRATPTASTRTSWIGSRKRRAKRWMAVWGVSGSITLWAIAWRELQEQSQRRASAKLRRFQAWDTRHRVKTHPIGSHGPAAWPTGALAPRVLGGG